MVGTRYQTQKILLRLVMILFGIASAAPAFFGSGAIAAANDGALRDEFLTACDGLSGFKKRIQRQLEQFTEACNQLREQQNGRALSDVRVNEIALEQFLRASVYQVSACLEKPCDDDINAYHPRGTATIFHVAKDSAGEPLVYFITAAHVVSSTPYCHFPGEETEPPDGGPGGDDQRKTVFLSRNFEDSEKIGPNDPWTEIVIEAREISRMDGNCDKDSKSDLYDVSILKLEKAFIFQRQSSKPDKSDNQFELFELKGGAILALMGDNYSRHAFVGMRDTDSQNLGSVKKRDSDSILGYFAGFPFSTTEIGDEIKKQNAKNDDQKKRHIYQETRRITSLTHAELSLGTLVNKGGAQEFQLEIDATQKTLISAQAKETAAAPGYSGATIHYYTGGRLHAVGVLNGRFKKDCDTMENQTCHYVYFTRLDRRPMWRLFTGLEPGEKITALADDFISGAFTEERWIHLTQLNDVENFWFGLQIIFKLLAEHNSRQLSERDSQQTDKSTKCPPDDDDKPLDRACIIDMLIGFKDDDSEGYYPTGLINVAKATPAIGSCGKRLSIHFRHRGFNGLKTFFKKSNMKNSKCIVPVAEDPVAVAEDIEIRKILVKMAYNDIRKLPNSAVDFTAGIAAHDRPFSKAIFGDDNYKSAVTAKSHYQVFGIPLRQGIFDFPAGPDGTKSWSVFGKKPGIKPPLERIPKSGNRFSEKMRDNTNN